MPSFILEGNTYVARIVYCYMPACSVNACSGTMSSTSVQETQSASGIDLISNVCSVLSSRIVRQPGQVMSATAGAPPGISTSRGHAPCTVLIPTRRCSRTPVRASGMIQICWRYGMIAPHSVMCYVVFYC